MKEIFLSSAEGMQQELKKHYAFLHKNAETEFELTKTVEYVKNVLTSIGIEPIDCGKCGVVAHIGNHGGACVLLRADMDALPMQEATELEYACTDGNMHACGHDMHTAMLLGAAKILKENEAMLPGVVKLMFQPAEETLSGASNMIENGVLDNPTVEAGLMLHVLTSFPVQSGTFVVAGEGISAPAADYFTINVHGKGCHGSTPNQGVDSLTVGAHILIALQELNAREINISDEVVLTIGSFCGGSSANIISESAVLKGTMRTFSDELRRTLKKRIEDIAVNVGKAFRANVTVDYGNGCPTLKNDGEMSSMVQTAVTELFGEKALIRSSDIPGGFRGGSEDFSYISHRVPSIMIGLTAGEPEKGYAFPQHHHKALFDESVMWRGSCVLSYSALKYLGQEK